jgi:L-gulonolactone oxidase
MSSVWRNWTGDQRCAPAVIERAGSEAEVVQAVGRARAAGRTLRVAGTGHSFNDAVLTDGHILHLGAMNRVLDADPSTGLVEVEAGITLHELGARLADLGLALENLGDVDVQSLAGAISTATHGTGARFANISSQVAALELVAADGSVVRCGEDDEDLLRAARVSIGALGPITSVTLRAVPLYTLRRVDEPMPLGATLDRLDELVDSRERFELFTLPYTDVALTRTTEKTDRPPAPPGAVSAWIEESLMENKLLALVLQAGRLAPGLIPRINRTVARAFSGGELVDHSHHVYANRRDVRFTEMEYAVPRERGAEALRRVMDMIERRRLPVGFPIEMRFVAPDDAFLSPAEGRATCYIAVHMYRGLEFETYFRAVEAIMDEYGGRPHWGKRHYQSAATLSKRYPDWDRFAAVRARLDPDGLFANDYVKRVLGPTG